VANRDITKEALRCLRTERLDHRALGTLLHRHQTLLRDPLGISTPKIDEMIQAAYDAGALGAKINGSGGGGCMFAYAPDQAEEVREALSRYGRTWIVHVDDGVRSETNGV
jgi:galactokinase